MALAGFDKDYYLAEKLAALQATESEWVGKDADFLETVLENVYGLTAEEHYMQYGWSEGIGPNAYFDADEYVLAKATAMFEDGNYLSIEDAQAAFEAAWGMDPYEHYLAYGAAEGINPSNDFDASDYLAAKLAALQADAATATEWADKTVDDLEAALDAAGLNALTHFVLYGEAEGLTAPAVDTDDQVVDGGDTPGDGTAYVLTTGIDTFTGTSDADTFTGLQTGGDDETFSAFDTLIGGDGIDTLTIINTEDAALNVASVQEIEIINIRDAGNNGNAAVDMDNFDGETTLNINSTQNAIAVTNLALDTALTVEGAKSNFDGNFTYDADTVDGTADAGAITIDGAADGSDIDLDGAIESLAITASGSASRLNDFTLTNDNAEAVTIDASVDFRVDTLLTADNAETLTITGAGDVRLDATTVDLSALVTVDASEATGDIRLKIDDAEDQTITTGTGDDTLDMDATLDKDDTIDLGDGTDTLMVDVDGLSAGSYDLNISNVEVLAFDNTAGNNGAIQMDNLAFDYINFIGANGAAQAATAGVITLTDIATTITTFNLAGLGALGAESDNVAFNGVTVDYDVSGTDNVSAATFNISNGGIAGDDFFVQKLTVDNTESILINASDIGTAAADELTITEVEGNDFTSIEVVTTGELIINDIDGDSVETVDLSGATGGMNVTISDHAAALVVTASSGADTITMTDNTNTSETTVDLGAGNDNFVSVDAADTVTTGTGADTISFQGDAADDLNIITDFTAGNGGDILDFVTSAASDSAATGEISVSAVQTANVSGSDVAMDSGLVIAYSANDAASLSIADIQAYLIDMDGAGNGLLKLGDQEAVYIAVDNGTDTAIVLFEDGDDDDDTVIDADELTLIVTLQGVEDASDLTAANFADFI